MTVAEEFCVGRDPSFDPVDDQDRKKKLHRLTKTRSSRFSGFDFSESKWSWRIKIVWKAELAGV